MTRSGKSLLLICLLLAALSTDRASSQAQERRPLQIQDLFALRTVRDPQLSPEGDWVAYLVSRPDKETDKNETSLWMVSSAGGEELRMTAQGATPSRPRWSPDGHSLSFQDARNGDKAQVWALNRMGGEARPLTKVKQGIQFYEWSPDSKRLVLGIKDPDPRESLTGQDGSAQEEKKEPRPRPWVIDRLQFKRDRLGYLDRRRTHLYLFEIHSRSLRQLTFGDFDDLQPAWSPDGRNIVFVSNRTQEPDGNSNSDLWLVPTDESADPPELRRLTTHPGADRNPTWSPDGSHIAYVTTPHPELIWYSGRKLALLEVESGESRILTAQLDRNVNDPVFSADGRGVFFRLEDSGQQHLARFDLAAESLTRPVAGPRAIRSFSLNRNGTIAVLNGQPHLPDEVFLVQDGLKQLTFQNRELLSKVELGKVLKARFPSRDGTRIEGFFVQPPGFREGTRYPTLLRIHGGPVSQYDFSFKEEAQILAGQGYLVVLVNPRGSSGYGQDFSMGIYRDWGNKDFQDVDAGIDEAVRRGWADPDRLGVGGWSYGGILTNYVITQSSRYKAAITGASEVLYVANYGHDHYQLQWEKELGLPWENRALWERLSPFNAVEKVVTPTLIMGGEKDWNVPIHNSEQLYQALKRLGQTTQLVVYPGESHGILRPSFREDRYQRYLDWYDRYVKGEDRAEAIR